MREGHRLSVSESRRRAQKHAVHHATQQPISSNRFATSTSEPIHPLGLNAHAGTRGAPSSNGILYRITSGTREEFYHSSTRPKTGMSQHTCHPALNRNPASMHVGGSQATNPTNVTSRAMLVPTLFPDASFTDVAVACLIIRLQNIVPCSNIRRDWASPGRGQ